MESITGEKKLLIPLEIIDKYGADALRMGLIVGNAIGNDIKFDENKIKGYRNFANKLWNIARFVLSRTEGVDEKDTISEELKSECDNLAGDITDDMKNYRLHLASEKIYHYIWHRLADEILEESKQDPTLLPTTYYLLQNSIKLLHPFMPFITEEIWSDLKSDSDSGQSSLLMIEPWPIK